MKGLAITLIGLFVLAFVATFALGYMAIFTGRDDLSNAAFLTFLLDLVLGIVAFPIAAFAWDVDL